MSHAIALALLWAGVGVAVLSALRALLASGPYHRLHYLTPITSVASPLVGLALAVDTGWQVATAEILVIVALLAATGPVLQAATARVAAQRDGLVPSESPR